MIFTLENHQSIADQQNKSRYMFNKTKRLLFTKNRCWIPWMFWGKQWPVTFINMSFMRCILPVNNMRQHVFAIIITACCCVCIGGQIFLMNNIHRPYFIGAFLCPPLCPQGPLLLTWISNYIQYEIWDEITYQFPTFYGCIRKHAFTIDPKLYELLHLWWLTWSTQRLGNYDFSCAYFWLCSWY